MDDDKVLEAVRDSARSELLPHFHSVDARVKADGSVITECDQRMQDGLQRVLTQALPSSVLLGEEMPADQQEAMLQQGKPVWCVDPLDGTSNFVAGIPFFSVSVALIEEGEVTFGMVYDPARDEMFSARKGQGAHVNGDRLSGVSVAKPLKACVANVDFKRLPKSLAAALATEPPYRSQRSFGSVALDWCWLAAGRGDLYLHGKQKLWDFAAGQLILNEVRGHAGTLEGETVYQGDLIPKSVLGALNKDVFKAWLTFCQARLT